MITFRDYMESALYEPGRGYYERRQVKADFYTAPELHPAFADGLAREIASRLDALQARKVPEPYFLVEMGAGDGTLAAQLYRALLRDHGEWALRLRLILVERSEKALIEAVLRVSAAGGKALGYSKLEDVPPCRGVFLSNELIDAFPVHLLEKRDGRVREVYVRQAGDSAWTELGDLSDPELAGHARAVAPNLPEGARHSVCLAARRWVREVARVLEAGTVLTVDYGRRLGKDAPNPPRAYFRHRTGPEVTARTGRQDITASVDFEALIDEGRAAGLSVDEYTTLGRFLLDRGILERLAAPGADPVASYKENLRIKTLFHPEGMGDCFKVLIQEKRP